MNTQEELEQGTTLALQFKKRGGFLPVVVQDFQSGNILMLGYANSEAVMKTLRTRYATFWSLSRNTLWEKGATSGNRLIVYDVLVDCDQDALVYRVSRENGGVCHTECESGEKRLSCFYRRINANGELEFLE